MRRWIVIGVAGWIAAVVGCVLGAPDAPGCREDADCGEGFGCRAGACFRESTGGAFVPPDAGDDAVADAAEDAGEDASADAAQDGDASTD